MGLGTKREEKERPISPSVPENYSGVLVPLVLTTLGPVGLEVLIPRGDELALGDLTRVLLNIELQLLPRHFLLPVPEY